MILDARHLRKSFGPVDAVDDVSFALAPQQTLSIVGESGCGKTTLAKILVGLLRPDSGEVITEAKIQMVFQDPNNSLDPLYTVRGILGEVFHKHKPPLVRREEQMAEVLVSVGLNPSVLSRFPHEFSGGERQRIAIARALLSRPQILVLDEVTSSLDVLVQKQIVDLLTQLKSHYGLTYIFISHNLRVVKRFSDTIGVMHEGKIVEIGGARQVFAQPVHPYTRQLLSAAMSYETQ